MSEFEISPLAESIVGSTGGLVFSSWKGKKYVKKKTKPTDTITQGKLTARASLARCTSLYKSLPVWVKESWRVYAFKKSMSGFNLFVSTNLSLEKSSQVLIPSPQLFKNPVRSFSIHSTGFQDEIAITFLPSSLPSHLNCVVLCRSRPSLQDHYNEFSASFFSGSVTSPVITRTNCFGDIVDVFVLFYDTQKKICSDAFHSTVDLKGYFMQSAVIYQKENYNVGGGNAAGGTFNTRVLNGFVSSIPDLYIDRNRVYIPEGSYLIDASFPAYRVDRHFIKADSITGDTLTLTGHSTISSNATYNSTQSILRSQFTLSQMTSLQFKHYTQTSFSLYGLGYPHDQTSYDNYYSLINILRIA